MKEDKSNGIGYIRFWAAFYDTDKKGRIEVYISGDQGESWESVASGLTPEKTLKEFQVLVNRPGNYRVKIAKSENSSDGVNIDNIVLAIICNRLLLFVQRRMILLAYRQITEYYL